LKEREHDTPKPVRRPKTKGVQQGGSYTRGRQEGPPRKGRKEKNEEIVEWKKGREKRKVSDRSKTSKRECINLRRPRTLINENQSKRPAIRIKHSANTNSLRKKTQRGGAAIDGTPAFIGPTEKAQRGGKKRGREAKNKGDRIIVGKGSTK